MRLAALVVLAAAACGKGETDGSGWARAGSAGSGAGSAAPVRITGWEPGCVAAFEAARTAPALERFAILARACPVCGVDWAPILDATRLTATGHTLARRDTFAAALESCGGVCTNQARDHLLDELDAIESDRTIDRPWKKLAKDCPGLLAPSPDDRFASAPWFVLTRIAAAKLPVSAPVMLPLPGQFTGGNGVELPGATHVDAELPPVHVTVLAKQVLVAKAPAVSIGADGLVLQDADGYPGAPVELAGIFGAVRAVKYRAGPTALLVPRAASATRVAEVATALHGVDGVRLAGFGPAPAEGWRDVARALLPTLYAPRGTHPYLTIALGPTPAIGLATAVGFSGDACRLAALDPADIVRRAVERYEQKCSGTEHFDPVHGCHPTNLAIAIDPAATVEELAVLLDALGGSAELWTSVLPNVFLVPAGWAASPAKLPPCP